MSRKATKKPPRRRHSASPPPIPVELVELAAQTVTLFEPLRTFGEPRNAAGIVEARHSYRRDGFPWRAESRSPADRLRRMRLADALEDGGLVRFHRANGKRISWQLSPLGLWKTRWWTLADGELELAAVMRAILANVERGYVVATRFVPEHALCGTWSSDRAGIITQAADAGLALGLLDSWSTSTGAVFFALADAGAKWLASWRGPSFTPPSPLTAEHQAHWTELAELHDRATERARRWRSSLRGEPGHVVVPWPSGFAPPSGSTPAPPIVGDDGELLLSQGGAP